MIFVVRYPPEWMNILRLNLFETSIHFAHSNGHQKSIERVKWSFSPKDRCPKSTLKFQQFLRYKFQKLLWECLTMPSETTWSICSFNRYEVACIKSTLYLHTSRAYLGMPDHTHLNLHNQFIPFTDMKLYVQNQLGTSFSFWVLKVLIASLGMPGHAWPHPSKIT